MIFLHSVTAKEIIQAIERGIEQLDISLDLGRTITRIDLTNPFWIVEQLEKIMKDSDSIYFVKDSQIFKAAISEDHFYKLFPTGHESAPALLIDGVLMHRVKDIDPIQDAAMKAELCARKGIDMLDICTGLGYSTIACLKRGVGSITTIERNRHVIELSKLNPWSRELHNDKRVSIIHGDAVERIVEFDTKSFHAVLHDPPRFSMGSELYTTEFYSQIYRVLKPRGVLYHYVGSPGGKHRKRDLPKGVIQRLRNVGFVNVKRNNSTLGVVAKKR
ncbi:MAG: class I SAM-dependent methyltransferase [Candidatus Thorarchaeota archaeon]|jgi:predicted methyltransferase